LRRVHSAFLRADRSLDGVALGIDAYPPSGDAFYGTLLASVSISKFNNRGNAGNIGSDVIQRQCSCVLLGKGSGTRAAHDPRWSSRQGLKGEILVGASSIIFTAVGVFLVAVGFMLLVVKVQRSETDSFKPIFQGPGKIMVSGPVGLVVIVIGVVCIALPVALSSNARGLTGPTHPTSSPVRSSTISVAASSPSPAVPVATLTSPKDGIHVSRASGFTASGKETSLGTETIWILDYDGGYTVDQEAIIANGRWSASDYPLGDAGNELPYDLTMVAALAKPACAAELTKVNEGNNDYLNRLPAGCKLFGSVTVDVVRP
jgi:hypothetical protein